MQLLDIAGRVAKSKKASLFKIVKKKKKKGQGLDSLAEAEQKESNGVVMKSRQCENGTSAAVLRAESRAFSFEKCAW